ncbi:HINT domain-containing protein [Streptomyces sp. DK15]|nr:HINT domain-containing protein [Streptomyces sp. DK15]
MADGSSKPIDDLQTGEKVVATDPETGETATKEITATIQGEGSKNLVEITVDTGAGAEVITATDNHPFWSVDLAKWTDATDLKPGQWLRTSAGTHVQITAVKRWTSPANVHNLTVADLHTYYVLAGATPVLVHNCGGTATIHYDGGHASIEVSAGGEALHTHQVGGLVEVGGETIATPVRSEIFTGAVSPSARSVTFNLPNPGGAMAYQEVFLERGVTGTYDASTETCFHYCARVLQAGGVPNVPAQGTIRELAVFLRRAGQ